MVPLPEMLHGRVIPTLEKTIRAQLNKGVWELLVKWTHGVQKLTQHGSRLRTLSWQFPAVELVDEPLLARGEMSWTLSSDANTSGTTMAGGGQDVNCC